MAEISVVIPTFYTRGCVPFLLRHSAGQTGVPVLLNTSFKENEPIVNCPEEALDCFLRTKMDVLDMGPYLLERVPSPRVSRTLPFHLEV